MAAALYGTPRRPRQPRPLARPPPHAAATRVRPVLRPGRLFSRRDPDQPVPTEDIIATDALQQLTTRALDTLADALDSGTLTAVLRATWWSRRRR
jgi:hypothetical protein